MSKPTKASTEEKAWAVAWAKLGDEFDSPPTMGALHARRLRRLRPPPFYEGFNSLSDCLEGPAQPEARVAP